MQIIPIADEFVGGPVDIVIFGMRDEAVGCGCGGDDDEEETDEDDDDQLVEYTCPHCGNEVTFEIDGFDLEEENLCPACGKPLFPIDGEDDEDSDQK